MTLKNVKLKELLTHRKGSITIDDNKDYKLCRVQLHRRGVVLRDILKGKQIKTKKQQVCKAGDFLVAEMDAKVGGYGFVPQELDGAIVSSHYFLFELNTKKLRPKYLEVVSQLLIIQQQIKAVGSTNYAAIRPNDVLNWEIPLPNIDKQKKIEELFDTTQEFGKVVLNELINQLNFINQLRQSFLREAMQGKLVQQDPNDKPASQLYEKIKAEKERLKNIKKISKDKLLSPIKAVEIPYKIPNSWVWCRLGEICETNGRIGWKGLTASEYKKSGPLFLSVHSLNHGDYVDYSQAFHISQERYDESPEIMLQNDDILICKDGAGIGKLGIIRCLQEQATINSSLLLIRGHSGLDIKFAYYYLLSPHFQSIVNARIMGATTPHLYQRDIVGFLFALPPIAEQNRIVNKLDELMNYCAELELIIIQSKEQTEQLLQVALKEALDSEKEIILNE